MTVSSPDSGRRSGRRPGPSTTREAITRAARAQFSELGYDRTTIRGVAREAGVDAALVIRFYGSKDALFREVMALPPAAADALERIADGPRETVGRRLAELIVGLLENPETRAIVLGRIRAASSHPEAAALVRETVTRDVRRLTDAVSDDEPDVRAVLAGTHVVGLAFARYVVLVEPLASMSTADLVEYAAPTFQRYLVGPLRDT